MAYGYDMAGAARRHLKAGFTLQTEQQPGLKPGSRAVSGYLFGLAAELAVKHMMTVSGMKPNPDDKRSDPFYAHFPHLRRMIGDTAQGRLQGRLSQISRSAIFDNWSTDMRYAPTSDIDDRWIDKWSEQAEQLVDKMSDV